MTQILYDDMLDRLQRDAFSYFVNEVNPANGFVKDCARSGFTSNIATFELATDPVDVEHALFQAPFTL